MNLGVQNGIKIGKFNAGSQVKKSNNLTKEVTGNSYTTTGETVWVEGLVPGFVFGNLVYFFVFTFYFFFFFFFLFFFFF